MSTESKPRLCENLPEMLLEVSWHSWTLSWWGKLTGTAEELVAGALQTLCGMLCFPGLGPSCVTLGK